jgi:hypothetical protein
MMKAAPFRASVATIVLAWSVLAMASCRSPEVYDYVHFPEEVLAISEKAGETYVFEITGFGPPPGATRYEFVGDGVVLKLVTTNYRWKKSSQVTTTLGPEAARIRQRLREFDWDRIAPEPEKKEGETVMHPDPILIAYRVRAGGRDVRGDSIKLLPSGALEPLLHEIGFIRSKAGRDPDQQP